MVDLNIASVMTSSIDLSESNIDSVRTSEPFRQARDTFMKAIHALIKDGDLGGYKVNNSGPATFTVDPVLIGIHVFH